MENLMFCLNATGPIFLMMVFGLFLRKVGILDEDFANRMNKFVFKIPLPFLLFSDLAAVDFSRVWNIKFIVFCFVVTLISITISTLISCLWRDKSIRGEFIQASYRSSAALLGIAFIREYLWKRRHGTRHDYRKRTALQRDGCYSAFIF